MAKLSLGLLALLLLTACNSLSPGSSPIQLVQSPESGYTFVVPNETSGGNEDRFLLHVVQPDGTVPSDLPPVAGELTTHSDHLEFVPTFPLQAGASYQVTFASSKETDGFLAEPLIEVFEIPAAPPQPRAFVEQVFPTAGTLPENQLKFYIHFSQPMTRGFAGEHVKLIHSSGREVELPFLVLDQELWDHDGKRLTVFFDPGRVKRELLPREEEGPALVANERYVLLISKEWKDAHGQQLKRTFRKQFQVTDADYTSPSPDSWIINRPAPNSKDDLHIQFPEPLDHALLQRLIWATDNSGEQISGEVTVSNHETEWRFKPNSPWPAGPGNILIRTTLEDLAGNSIGQPFEVKLPRPSASLSGVQLIQLPLFPSPSDRN